MPRGTTPKLPTVRGLFVTGHIERLRKARGDGAVAELERRWGGPLFFKKLEEVPVSDEAKILNLIVEIESGAEVPPSGAALDRAAGRLHFTDFVSTTLGATLLGALPRGAEGVATLLHNAGSIVRFVFKNLEITCEEHSKALVVVMRGSEYPPEHFCGFFEALMRYCGVPEEVSVKVRPGVHEYTLVMPQK